MTTESDTKPPMGGRMTNEAGAATATADTKSCTGSGAAVRTPFEQRRDFVARALRVTVADATGRLNALVTNLAPHCGESAEAARAKVLELDPERLVDLLACGPHEAARLIPKPLTAARTDHFPLPTDH